MPARITSPNDDALAELCAALTERAPDLDRTGRWPAQQLQLLADYGVYEWFVAPEWGGQDWDDEQSLRGYMTLASACLTTAFILTQRTGACRRIAHCHNENLKQRWLPGLASGELFATVGISHLTTSRRHLARPVLAAEATPTGFRLTGMSPWVTGAAAADVLVLAATLVEGDSPTNRELLVAVPRNSPGLFIEEPHPLVGLSASATGAVKVDKVDVPIDSVIVGPAANVMAGGVGGSTGGLETSALALGLARAGIDFLNAEATKRPDLQRPADMLAEEHRQLVNDLLGLVGGNATSTKESVRQRANTFVLRATEAALSAAKGTGYVIGHPAGRWCREALFFLVWSCPQPVAAANLCELAGLAD